MNTALVKTRPTAYSYQYAKLQLYFGKILNPEIEAIGFQRNDIFFNTLLHLKVEMFLMIKNFFIWTLITNLIASYQKFALSRLLAVFLCSIVTIGSNFSSILCLLNRFRLRLELFLIKKEKTTT